MSLRRLAPLLVLLVTVLLVPACKKKHVEPSYYDATYRLEPSTWTGTLTVPQAGGPQTFQFELGLEKVTPGGKVEGYMDWGNGLRAAVKGTVHGNHLELVDTAFISGSGGKLGEKKDLYIMEGRGLGGTDKDGAGFISGSKKK